MKSKILFFLFLILIVFSSCQSKTKIINAKNLGVWWWDDDLGEEYLEFAFENYVNEIYYCTSDFNQKTKSFIKKASEYNMDVYLLAGEYQWIYDDTTFNKLMSKYTTYQGNSKKDEKFSGVHLDIEPHQDPDFSSERSHILKLYLDLVINIKNKYGTIDFDIPFWFDDLVNYNNEEVNLYKAVINEAGRVFVMAYRDTKEKIYDISKEEILYAQSINKQIVIALETYSNEGNQVSFFEEGKKYMYNQINSLIAEHNLDSIAIHHIKTWKEMME